MDQGSATRAAGGGSGHEQGSGSDMLYRSRHENRN